MIIIDDFYKIKKQQIYDENNWKRQISFENIKLLIKKFERNFIELPYWSNKKKFYLVQEVVIPTTYQQIKTFIICG